MIQVGLSFAYFLGGCFQLHIIIPNETIPAMILSMQCIQEVWEISHASSNVIFCPLFYSSSGWNWNLSYCDSGKFSEIHARNTLAQCRTSKMHLKGRVSMFPDWAAYEPLEPFASKLHLLLSEGRVQSLSCCSDLQHQAVYHFCISQEWLDLMGG